MENITHHELRKITEELIDLCVIANMAEISDLAGKKPSWISTTLSRQRLPSLDALVHLFVNISDVSFATRTHAHSQTDGDEAESYLLAATDLDNITQSLWLEIQRRCRNA